MVKIIRYLHIGPGGINCQCCFSNRGKRKPNFRQAKRRASREATREISACIMEIFLARNLSTKETST